MGSGPQFSIDHTEHKSLKFLQSTPPHTTSTHPQYKNLTIAAPQSAGRSRKKPTIFKSQHFFDPPTKGGSKLTGNFAWRSCSLSSSLSRSLSCSSAELLQVLCVWTCMQNHPIDRLCVWRSPTNSHSRKTDLILKT